MPLSWIIMGILALSPLVTYGAMRVNESWAVSAATKSTQATERAACTVKMNEFATTQNAAVAANVSDARAAGDAVSPTPEEDEAKKELCRKSASCRSRSTL
jgi:hypothetical protein